MSNDQLTELKQFFVVTLDTALEPIRADIGQLKTDVQQMQMEIRHMQAEIRHMQTDIKHMKADIKHIQADIRQLQVDLRQLREEMEEGFVAVGETFDQFYVQEDRRSNLLQELAQKWRAEAKN